MKKVLIALIIVLPIIMLLVLLAGYAGYCALAQYEFSQGQAAFEAKDWLTAWEHFERTGRFYKFALPSHTNEASTQKDQSSLLIFMQDMRDKGDYQSALDACNSFMALYPKADAVSSVKEVLPAIYMDWGISLRNKSDFAGAAEKFQTVIREYPQSSSGDPLKELAETYRAWGDALAKTEEYETAIDKYQLLLEKFPTQPAAQGIQNVLGGTYLNWANQLRKNKQPELALEKYNSVIANFGGTPAATKASAALAPTMLEWTLVLHADKKFTKEVEILRKLMADYKNSPEAQQASQKIVAAYDSLGRQLMNEKSFISSMQVYDDAKEFASNKDAKSVVDAGYNDAVKGLAADTGKDGARIIDETSKTACAGKPALSPAVGISKTQGKGRACSGGYDHLPNELMAFTPGEFKYVVVIEFTREANVGNCSYSGGHLLIKQVSIYTATVYSTATGKKINKRDFRSSDPACPQSRTFYSQTEYITNNLVSDEDISAWLQSIFKR